ncbi:MAG: EcsC family protein [Oscillospiraceae bacterium]|nr:EcsC family protein [Oscillospiraceae bacterium]
MSKQAGRAGNINLAVSSAAGVGLGVLGIGIPDIVLFVSLVLKSLYQICTSYGVDYTIEREKKFILLVIRGAVATGEEYLQIDREIDYYIRHGEFAAGDDLYQSVKKCSACLSKELLYMKFLQGIPLVGAVGGAYDYVYMKKINSYARIKFHKRYIHSKMHR